MVFSSSLTSPALSSLKLKYSVFDLLTFSPLSSKALPQHSVFHSASSLLLQHMTISSANSINHGAWSANSRALQAIFEKFSAVGLTLNKDECSFDQSSLKFFGFVVSAAGISPDPKKVKAIHNAPSPTSAGAVGSFLGMVNYCATFIPNFSDMKKPLRALTTKNVLFKWTDGYEQAFLDIKQALTSDIVMSYFDKDKCTEIITDASPYGVSAILTQTKPGKNDRKVVSC